MSTSATPLEIPGYQDRPLPCVLHADGDESTVAVVFPGGARYGNRLGGTPARPDLHYTRAVLRAEGIAVFEVWWDAGSAPPGPAESDWLDANSNAALAAATAERDLGFLIGRSFGSCALAHLLTRAERSSDPPPPTIWLAPLMFRVDVASALTGLRSPAFVLGGSNDRAFDVAEAERLREAGVEVGILEGANHGLEVEDPSESARLLADVLDQLREFVRRYAK